MKRKQSRTSRQGTGTRASAKPKSSGRATPPGEQVRSYLATLPDDARRAAETLRATIRSVAPDATEGISYGIPAFKLDGRPLVYYAAWTQHTSMYPITGAIQRALSEALAGYETSKGTVRFPLSSPVPVTLVKRLVKARLTEIRASNTATPRRTARA